MKGTSLGRKHKRRKRPTGNIHKTIKKILIGSYMYIYNYFKCKGFSGGSAGKQFTCNVGDLDLIPGLGRSPGKETLPTPVFWPGEFHGLLDMTEQLSLSL